MSAELQLTCDGGYSTSQTFCLQGLVYDDVVVVRTGQMKLRGCCGCGLSLDGHLVWFSRGINVRGSKDLNSILANDFDAELWLVDDQTLLDLIDALLYNIKPLL